MTTIQFDFSQKQMDHLFVRRADRQTGEYKQTSKESVKFALTVSQRVTIGQQQSLQEGTGSRFTGRPINERDKMANNTLENVHGMTVKVN